MIKLVNVYQAGRIIPGAIEFLYALMEQREPEINISHRELPTLEQHRQFMERRPYRCWYLIEIMMRAPDNVNTDGLGPVWVGYISATHNNEIGIVLRKEHRHRGYGSASVLEFIRMHSPLDPVPSQRNGRWVANVAPGNAPSRGMFEKLGSTLLQVTYELPIRQEEPKP